MTPSPFLGTLLHAIGGLAAASFYVPYSRVRKWDWENYWLAGGIFSWLVTPWVLALILVPGTLAVLGEASGKALFWTYTFGLLWGVGGLTYGLTVRFLGLALGNAVALGLCAFFGTLMEPLYTGELFIMLGRTSGKVTLLGVTMCVAGIALGGLAGVKKEKELSDEQKISSLGTFNLAKGLVVAVISGVMSACMAYSFAAGKPIGKLAVEKGAPTMFQNLPVLAVALLGGLTTNFIYCAYLMIRKNNLSNYWTTRRDDEPVPLTWNYLFCVLAGVTWYMQFFFYGMGTTKMGEYDFTSWSLHMSSIIIFGTVWGALIFKEWKGTSKRTHAWMAMAVTVLILSMVTIGYGNRLESLEESPGDEPAQSLLQEGEQVASHRPVGSLFQ